MNENQTRQCVKCETAKIKTHNGRVRSYTIALLVRFFYCWVAGTCFFQIRFDILQPSHALRCLNSCLQEQDTLQKTNPEFWDWRKRTFNPLSHRLAGNFDINFVPRITHAFYVKFYLDKIQNQYQDLYISSLRSTSSLDYKFIFPGLHQCLMNQDWRIGLAMNCEFLS